MIDIRSEALICVRINFIAAANARIWSGSGIALMSK